LSDEHDNENVFKLNDDEITSKIIPLSTKIFAKSIVEGLRTELLRKEEEIIGRLEKWLVSTLIRRLIHSFIMDLDKIVQSAIELKADEAEERIRKIVQEEIRRAEERIRRAEMRERVERVVPTVIQTTPEEAGSEAELRMQLRECKAKIADLNDRLGKLFNLMIKFEPRIQALPIIEQFGEISVNDLSRMINIEKNHLMEFLKATSHAGLTVIRGEKIKVLKPIFKRG